MGQPANEINLHAHTAPSLNPVQAPEAEDTSATHLDFEVPTLSAMVAHCQLESSQSVPVSVDAVASVFTDHSLLSCIGAFQPDPLAFLPAYELTNHVATGSLVKEAIARDDLDELKKIYSARCLDADAAKKPALSFSNAMNDAVTEGRLTIMQWLHARSRYRPRDVYRIPCKSTLRMILCASRMDVVQCLFDLRDIQIDWYFMHILADALHNTPTDEKSASGRSRSSADDPYSWTMSLLQLLVQQRPEVHSRLLKMAADAGSMEAVSYMLSPRSGVDLSKVAMLPAIIAAARGGHRQVVDVLLSAKRDDEVVDVATVRGQLSSVRDVKALQWLLEVLAQRVPLVQAQLNEEREAANAIFGFVPMNEDATTTKRKTPGFQNEYHGRIGATTGCMNEHSNELETTKWYLRMWRVGLKFLGA